MVFNYLCQEVRGNDMWYGLDGSRIICSSPVPINVEDMASVGYTVVECDEEVDVSKYEFVDGEMREIVITPVVVVPTVESVTADFELAKKEAMDMCMTALLEGDVALQHDIQSDYQVLKSEYDASIVNFRGNKNANC